MADAGAGKDFMDLRVPAVPVEQSVLAKPGDGEPRYYCCRVGLPGDGGVTAHLPGQGYLAFVPLSRFAAGCRISGEGRLVPVVLGVFGECIPSFWHNRRPWQGRRWHWWSFWRLLQH